MHRRQMLGLAGALVGAGSAASWLTGARGSDGDDDGEDGVPAGDAVEDPRSGLQRIIWTVDTAEAQVALSFDDGPHPALTPRILEILDEHEMRATFMAMGHAAREHPQLMAAVVEAGHEVGHHTLRHRNLATTSDEETRQEIEEGARAVAEAAGVPVRLFRPPRGRLSEAAIRVVAQQRHDIVLWSVTRGALDERSPRRVADYVLEETGPGDIIDLHDGIGRGTFEPGSEMADELLERRLTEIQALPLILDGFRHRGMRVGAVGDLMDVQGPVRA